MSEGLAFTSYMLAALSGIFFVKGLVVLSGGGRKQGGEFRNGNFCHRLFT